MIAAVRSDVSVNESVLYVAFELGKKQWKLAMTSGFGMQPWLRTVASGDLAAVTRVVQQARARFGVDVRARVVSCYEAGRGGFLVPRALQGLGIEDCGGGSASRGGNRRA